MIINLSEYILLNRCLVSFVRAPELDLPETRMTLTPHLPCPDEGAKIVEENRTKNLFEIRTKIWSRCFVRANEGFNPNILSKKIKMK
jgi:hypothetical protein